jgi:hypothetical protein
VEFTAEYKTSLDHFIRRCQQRKFEIDHFKCSYELRDALQAWAQDMRILLNSYPGGGINYGGYEFRPTEGFDSIEVDCYVKRKPKFANSWWLTNPPD